MRTLHEEANAKPRANIFAKNDVFRRRAPMIKLGGPPQWSLTGKEDTGDVWSQSSRGGYGEV